MNKSASLQEFGPLDDRPDAGQGVAERPKLFSAAALESLYRSQAARLIRRFARTVGMDDASEVVQEAFAKLARADSASQISIERPEAFVATVATNVLRDRARSAARQAIQLQSLQCNHASLSADPHDFLQSREALRAIERALAAMPTRRRRIFLLHRFEQMTYAEIGAEVAMSERGVKKQMSKALFELRRAAGHGA